MVEELAPALRYCNYQISRAGGEAVDTAGLLALAEEGGEGGGSLLQVRLGAGAGAASAVHIACCLCMCCLVRQPAAGAAESAAAASAVLSVLPLYMLPCVAACCRCG
jgi:hypothetical protein